MNKTNTKHTVILARSFILTALLGLSSAMAQDSAELDIELAEGEIIVGIDVRGEIRTVTLQTQNEKSGFGIDEYNKRVRNIMTEVTNLRVNTSVGITGFSIRDIKATAYEGQEVTGKEPFTVWVYTLDSDGYPNVKGITGFSINARYQLHKSASNNSAFLNLTEETVASYNFDECPPGFFGTRVHGPQHLQIRYCENK